MGLKYFASKKVAVTTAAGGTDLAYVPGAAGKLILIRSVLIASADFGSTLVTAQFLDVQYKTLANAVTPGTGGSTVTPVGEPGVTQASAITPRFGDATTRASSGTPANNRTWFADPVHSQVPLYRVFRNPIPVSVNNAFVVGLETPPPNGLNLDVTIEYEEVGGTL